MTRLPGSVSVCMISEDFDFLAGRDAHDFDGVADHIGGAPLAFRAGRHRACPTLIRSPLSSDPFQLSLIPLAPQEGHSRARPGPFSPHRIRLSILICSVGQVHIRLHAFR